MNLRGRKNWKTLFHNGGQLNCCDCVPNQYCPFMECMYDIELNALQRGSFIVLRGIGPLDKVRDLINTF